MSLLTLLNKRKAGFPAPFVVPDSPRGAIYYDSNMVFKKNNASLGFNTAMETIFTAFGGVQRFGEAGATGGKSIADQFGDGRAYLVDDTDANPDNWTRSADYLAFQAAHTVNENTIDYCEILGQTNNVNSTITFDPDKYENVVLKIIQFHNEDKVNSQYSIITPPPRQFGGTVNDRYWVNLHKRNENVVNSSPRIFKGASCKDQDMRDTSHPTDAAFQDATDGIAYRDAQIHGWISKKGNYPYGPIPFSAVLDFDVLKMTCDFSLSGGDDVVVGAGSHPLLVLDDGTDLFTATKATRLSQGIVQAEFIGTGINPNDLTEFHIARTSLNTLPQASAPFIYDNASPNMPINDATLTKASGKLTLSDTSIAWAVDYDVNPAFDVVTYSSTGGFEDKIIDIADRGGIGFSSIDDYGFSFNDTNRTLYADDALTAAVLKSAQTGSASHWVFLGCKTPATIASNGIIWGTGNAASVQSTPRTSLRLLTGAGLQWLQNEASGGETLGSWNFDDENFVFINFVSASEAYAYVNSLTPYQFDPRDNMLTQTHVWFGGGDDASGALNGVADLEFRRVMGKFGSFRSSEDIEEFLTAYATRYSISIS